MEIEPVGNIRGRLVSYRVRPWRRLVQGQLLLLACWGTVAAALIAQSRPFWVRLAGRLEARGALDCPLSPLQLYANGRTRTSRSQVAPMLALGERTGKREDCLLMLSDRNVQVVAREIQEHPLLG